MTTDGAVVAAVRIVWHEFAEIATMTGSRSGGWLSSLLKKAIVAIFLCRPRDNKLPQGLPNKRFGDRLFERNIVFRLAARFSTGG